VKGSLTSLVFLVTAWPLQAADAPEVTITLADREATATPTRQGFSHTGGGNIDVAQPSPDTLVITMTGVAVAGGHPCKDSLAALAFQLTQDFEVAFAKADRKKARLTLEGRVIGLLRSQSSGGGSAQINCPASAVVTAGGAALCDIALPGRAVSGGDNLSINDHRGPVGVVIPAGKLTLHQSFGVEAVHPRKCLPCKAASAEFAPDPALDPLWISAFEPFHGANKKDFGFQVTIRVAAD
jgi:hypothetical protein